MDLSKKQLLDNLVKKYEISEFIPDDPVKFPHLFDDKLNQEVSGLISSCLAYGKREKILDSVDIIHKIMDYKPYEFAVNFDPEKDSKLFSGFKHRFTADTDIVLLIYAIGKALSEYKTLEELFLQGYSPDDYNIRPALTQFVDKLRSFASETKENQAGLFYLIPTPEKGSACKRLNLFLKWMVRPGPVDLNIWQSVSKEKLIIPLDAHVSKLSRKLGLTNRKPDDWKTAEDITENLKQFDRSDPVKYDFAIFGMGIYKEN